MAPWRVHAAASAPRPTGLGNGMDDMTSGSKPQGKKASHRPRGEQGQAAGHRRATISDVATAAQLSITQVSRALAGYSDVAAATRERVRQLAAQMGYRPSQRARSLALGRQATKRCAVVSLGLPAMWLHRSSYGPVLPGVMAGAATEGMDVHLAALDAKSPVDELARFVAEDRADGILLMTFQPLEPAHLTPLEEAGIPYVLVNRHFKHVRGGPAVNWVVPDWAGGSRDIVERMHRLGHRDIAMLLTRRETSTIRDHERGWTEAVKANGLDPAHAPLMRDLTGADSEQAGYSMARSLLTEGLPKTGKKPTAVAAINETVAYGVLRAARELEVTVPEQLSVIGFDDAIGRYLWPALCSYDPHFFSMGERAALLLASLLSGEAREKAPPSQIVIPLDYICRSTCAAAPQRRASRKGSSASGSRR